MARVVLADDDAATRDLVKRALESDGHKVSVAEDGNEALDRLASGADILVSDVNMPGLDGITLATRAAASAPGLRVLLMSGFPEELERARRAGLGRLGVLAKPFTLEQVRSAVRALIG